MEVIKGRMYDYNNGRFLSVDPFIQSPTSTQSMNPYTYIFNNPLSGVDPTGYKAKIEKERVTGSHIAQDKRKGPGNRTKPADFKSKVSLENGGDSATTRGPETQSGGKDGLSAIGGHNNTSQGLTNGFKSDEDIRNAFDKSVEENGVTHGSIRLNGNLSFKFSTSGSEEFHGKVNKDLIKLNKNKFGKKLLNTLASSREAIQILETNGINQATEKGNGTTIAFDPRDVNLPIAFESRRGKPVNRAIFKSRFKLAHELFHALQNSPGAIAVPGGWVRGERLLEVNAVRYVNQIRKADNSQQFRVQYSIGGPRVDSFSDIRERTEEN